MTVIGVTPRHELGSRPRLFNALAAAFDVRFEPCEPDDHLGLSARVEFDAPGRPEPRVPTISLRLLPPTVTRTKVVFGATDTPHPAFNGRTFEEREPAAELDVHDGDRVICHAGRPLWLISDVEGTQRHASATSPAELGPGDGLRDHLTSQRFLGLLPLVHFLRELTRGRAFRTPPLRAAFLFDDPNIHWPSYGFVDFQALAEEARRSRYHAAFATIPLDSWFVSQRAARIFREHPRQLSLLVHGNNHLRRELGRLDSVSAARATAIQALQRIERLERRAGVGVARVMAAPHGACSEPSMTALRESGFDALCIGRSRPWLGATKAHPLEEFGVAEFVNGLATIPRQPLSHSWDELCFHAFLGQPLILYGHHDDLSNGDDVLSRAAEFVNGFGSVQWLALGDIARTNVSVKREGAAMVVQPHARLVEAEFDDEVEYVRLVLPDQLRGLVSEARLTAPGRPPETVAISSQWPTRNARSVSVELLFEDAVGRADRPLLRLTAIAAVRRLMTETRDRVAPFTRERP